MGIKKKRNLSFYIILGLILGIIFGFVLKSFPEGDLRDVFLVDGLLRFLGTGFISLAKMVVAPLVFFSITYAVATMSDIKKLGRISGKTVLFYMSTTGVAVAIAIGLAILLNPGGGLDMSYLLQSDFAIPESQSVTDTFLAMIPTNPFASLANGDLLQIIIFAILAGVSISLIGDKKKPILELLDSLNAAILKLVSIVMLAAPVGVFALITQTVYSTGFDSLISVAKMIGVVALAMVIHGLFVYGGILKVLTRLPLKQFFKAYIPVASVTFTTSSSNAALPLSMEAMDKLGVNREVSSFTLPLGATINMDGTAIMQGVAAVFIAQIYQIDITTSMILAMILTAVLASIGTSGTPGVGMITLAMVIESAGLPVEGIALIYGFDRILDMMRTTVNVMGDCVCSVVVANSEKGVDKNIYLASDKES